MNRLVALALCVMAVALSPRAGRADTPAPTEEQIEAKLKEAQKQMEALQAQIQALQKQWAEAKERPAGRISAAVEGALLWDDGGMGYYIRVRSDDDPKQETRVWLWYSEQKVLVRTLEGLQGKQVSAAGKLRQAPANGKGRLPPAALYLDAFEIKQAPPQAERSEAPPAPGGSSAWNVAPNAPASAAKRSGKERGAIRVAGLPQRPIRPALTTTLIACRALGKHRSGLQSENPAGICGALESLTSRRHKLDIEPTFQEVCGSEIAPRNNTTP